MEVRMDETVFELFPVACVAIAFGRRWKPETSACRCSVLKGADMVNLGLTGRIGDTTDDAVTWAAENKVFVPAITKPYPLGILTTALGEPDGGEGAVTTFCTLSRLLPGTHPYVSQQLRKWKSLAPILFMEETKLL